MISELFSGNAFLWTCVWQSTVCVVLGLVGSFIFRHWPARAHRVLFVAMIAAVIVPILSSLVRYYELGIFVAEPAVIQSGVEDLPRVNNYGAPEIMPDEDFEYTLNVTEEYSAPATVAQSEGINIPWGRVILWGWGAASLILTLRLVLTFVFGVRLLGRALPLGREEIRKAVHVARAKLGFGRNVEVYSSAGVCSPVIWCWGRQPVLLVPSGSGRVDNRVNWVSVLCHELAHWKRRDHISGLLAELMVCIFPWNPLMWLAKRRLVSLSEQACDDWVLASGQLGTNYAQSLLDLAPQGQMAFVPAVVGSKKVLGARIRRILKDKCGNPRTGVLWVLFVSILAAAVVTAIAFAQKRPAKAIGIVMPANLDKDIVLYYSFDADMGRQVTDLSGKTNHGNVRSGTYISNGKFGRAMFFNGDGDYIDIGDNSSTQTEVFTFSAWVKTSDTREVWQSIVSFEEQSYAVSVLPNGHVHYGWQGVKKGGEGTSDVRTGRWIFVAVARDSDNKASIYVNGKLENSFLCDTNSKFFHSGKIGGEYYGSEYFNGSIDEVRIHSRALSASEVRQLYDLTSSTETPIRSKSMDIATERIRIEPDPEEGQVKVSGIVRDEGGRPVSDVLITFLPMGGQEYVTNDKGEFAGFYLLKHTPRSNQIYVFARRDERKLAAAAKIFKGKDSELEIELTEAVTLTGQITDPNGNPIPTANMYVILCDDLWGAFVDIGGEYKDITIDSSGSYEIRLLPPGCFYEIVARAPGYGRRTLEVGTWDKSKKRIQLDTIILPPANLSVSGVVVDEKGIYVPHTYIEWEGEGQPYQDQPIQTDERGNFTIEKLCDGTITITATVYDKNEQLDKYEQIDAKVGGKDVKVAVEKTIQVCPIGPKLPSLMGKELPEFKDLGLNINKGKIKDKMLLICFWDMNNQASRHCVRKLVHMFEELKRRDIVVVSVYASKIDKKSLADLVKKYDIPFPVGMVSDEIENVLFKWGVGPLGLPKMILTDRNNIVITEGFGLQALRKLDEKTDMQVKIKRPRSGSVRIVHFPKDRSLGTLKVQTFEPSQPYKLDITGYGDEWQYFGQAVGDVTVPAGKRLQLVINRPNQDLSPLRRLRPDDLYMLIIDCGVNPASNADVTIMPHLSGLTELKVLYLFRANITGKGLRHIRGFKSLRRLILRLEQRIDNAALAELANLESLQELVVNGRFTDTGLRHLEKLTSLRELSLEVTRVRGPGLAYLEKLPQLRYLQLVGQNFGDDGLAYLRNLKSLKKLHLFGQLQITDAGLAHLSNLTGLEELQFTWIEGITDAGLVHLKPLSTLKKLDIGFSAVTDAGMSHLSNMKTLEYLVLPSSGITDSGLPYLSKLKQLKHLRVGMSSSGSTISDKGLKVLSGLENLAELWIGGEGITDAGIADIARLSKLNYLLLCGCPRVTSSGLAELAALESLKTLYIHDSSLTVSGLSALNAMPGLTVLNAGSLVRDNSVLDISGMTNLERLSLGFGHDTDQYWTDADLACLANLSNLKWLQIYPRKFSDVGMAHLADLTNLECLGVGGGKLTDDGLLYLANMNKLNHLTISDGAFASGGNLTDKGLRHLEGLKALSYLSVNSDKDFSPAALQRLRKNLPNLATLMVNEKSGGIGGGIAFSQTRPALAKTVGTRIVHFPKDRSLGTLKIQDADTIGRVKDFYNIGKADWWFPDWEHLGQAKGDVTVPAGKLLALRVSKPEQWRNLSPLGELDKDDLYLLNIEGSYYGGPKPRDACMKHITRLTGLKRLEIMYTDITARGIQQIEKLKSLETLVIAGKLDDAGLAVISKLPSLKYLYIQHQSQITNAGMRHLGQLKLLEELVISGGMVGDEGLIHLSKLPRLRFLKLYGQRFTDDGMVHLKKIPNLKSLQVDRLTQLTDKALMHISGCDSLETVSFHANENITDKGAEYLSTMKSLKRLDINKAQITGEGVRYLSQIKSLEQLDLPSQILGDRELGYLSNLGNLRDLRLDRTHFIDPDMDKGFYTDKGVKELSKLRMLEKLSLGSRGLTDEGMDYICMLTNLKGLHLFYCINVTDKGLAKLGKLKSLESLSITRANMTISGLSALNNLSNLKHLDVVGMVQDGSVLDISGLTKLENLTIGTSDKGGVIRDEDLACLANLKDLKMFQISSAIQPLKPMAISDKGMAYLEGLTKMERLTIGGNLTDEGLKNLRNMKNMDRLGIYCGRFTDKGLHHLEGLTKLSSLTIYADNNFSPQALQRLREKLPNLVSLNTGDIDQVGSGMGGYAGKN